MTTTIAVSTFRRPEELRALVDSILFHTAGRQFELLIIDNDPSASASWVVEDAPWARYIVESEPGIVATRNRALREAGDGEYIIFIDDDETVTEGWLDALVAHQRRSGSGAVYGTVETVLPASAPGWVVRGGFVQRRRLVTGEPLKAAATNNVLLCLAQWREMGRPTFDPTFSSTGGSDSDFFSRLHEAGLRIEACAEAVVREEVPLERTTLRWLVRRAVRNGVVLARLWARNHPMPMIAAKGLLFIASGSALQLYMFLTLRGLNAAPFNRLFNGVGILGALWGMRIHEYRRPNGG